MAKKALKSNVSKEDVSKSSLETIPEVNEQQDVTAEVIPTTEVITEPSVESVEPKEEPKSNVSLNNQCIHGGFYRNYGGLI